MSRQYVSKKSLRLSQSSQFCRRLRACTKLFVRIVCTMYIHPGIKLGMNRKQKGYPSDVSDEEWSFCVNYLTLMKECAPQRHIQENWPDSWKYSYPYDLAEVYGEITNRGYAYAYDNRRRQTLRLLTEVLTPGARILDVAAAQGNFSIALAEMGYNVTWNDLREDLADYVRFKYERGEIHFAAGNAFE